MHLKEKDLKWSGGAKSTSLLSNCIESISTTTETMETSRKSTQKSSQTSTSLQQGFPVSRFSIAGKRKGLTDERGMPLWKALFDIIRIKEPKVILIENVKGLLSSNKGKDFAWVLVQMAELGYSVEWCVLNSKDFGVPQNRERVFIIGYSGGECPAKVFPLTESDIVCYQPPEKASGKRPRIWHASGICRAIDANYKKGGGSRTHIVLLSHTKGNIKQRVQERDTSWSIDTSGNKIGVITENLEIRKLTPLECFRLQGFPDDIVHKAREIGISDTQLYKMAGNAVTIPVVQTIARKLRKVVEKRRD